MPSKRKQKALEAKRTRKRHRMKNPGDESRYARKRSYLDSHGGWGFDYEDPKPWR